MMHTLSFSKHWKHILFVFACTSLMFGCGTDTVDKTPRVLVFSKTAGFYHKSIPAGIAAIQQLGHENGFLVDTTKNSAYFTDDSLKRYRAVIFLSTTGDVLDFRQQAAFERYIQAGGSFVGIHAATDTEYDWPWYNKLVGAYFLDHPNNPNVHSATVQVLDTTHQSTKGLPERWERVDEWYNFRDINPDINVLATMDESTYKGGKNGDNHPIIWYHEYDGGRAFYTGGGHTDESFSEPLFLQHLLGGIQYAIDGSVDLDYSKATTMMPPEENRFEKTILSDDLNEPMELAVGPDGKVYFIERAGKFFVYDPVSQSTKLLHDFPVKAVEKYLNGLLGITLDPDFSDNRFIYFFYTTEENDQHKQRIARFVLKDDDYLDLNSEKAIIEVPIDLEVSAHTGGSMVWDKDKNLYISTGDNTVPFASDGYSPIDERPGRHTFDAQRSSANPNDLRGKILRIRPQADGSYTIPEGNLFPPGTPDTRPEIYVMGCRNPYRISIDQKTGILYWGEIGPDAGKDGDKGPRGYDELNQAKQAGNFGWPYFVGDNKPYKHYNFATNEIGDDFDPNATANNSVNNTGATNLPPAQGALIWYPYSASEEFPLLGDGGRCIMAGPVYHFDETSRSQVKIPEYYDKALFIYDWMRNWIFAVRLDENHDYQSMEPFMPAGDFRRPVDMEVGPDGAFYILEYGSVYGIDNEDARLVKVEYNAGNRAPVAKIKAASDPVGLAPLTITFDADESFDLDHDKLTYNWTFSGQKASSKESTATFTFEENGSHHAVLTVTDPSGASSSDTITVVVGNTRPTVTINSNSNTTFFFDGKPFDYAVTVEDKEDKRFEPNNLTIRVNYVAELVETETIGHQVVSYNLGKTLIESSDCKACHQIDKKAIGPTFMDIADKYADDKTAPAYLANKIIMGGGGVWGPQAMNAHPQLTREEATEMVKYILSLAEKAEENRMPQEGVIELKEHEGSEVNGVYLISAEYTDLGEGSAPVTGNTRLVLRSTKIEAEDADEKHHMMVHPPVALAMDTKAYLAFKDIDLKDINKLNIRYSSPSKSGKIEVRYGSPDGILAGEFTFKATNDQKNMQLASVPIEYPGEKVDVYLVMIGDEPPHNHLVAIDWVEFMP